MQKKPFERVILYARQHRANQGVSETLHRLNAFLKTQTIEILADPDTTAHFETHCPTLPRDQLGKHRDLMIVVGGDGSLLSAARIATCAGVPVIGINRGRLGFLTDISPLAIEEQLSRVLKGHYQQEKRFLLQIRIHDEDTTYFQGKALNDVVLNRGNETHLIEFDVYINQRYVCHYRSDGLILATPTGSTAYALSAGGPIIHPGLNTILLVPLFSHSLSSRPLLIDGEDTVDLFISEDNECDLRVSCDGHESRMVKPGQRVTVEKNDNKLCLLHPEDYHYYDTLRIKLGWESRNPG